MTGAKRKRKKVVSEPERKQICIACKESFQYYCQLRLHIRQQHFNRIGLVPYADSQHVNDVWVEKVENSDALVEIKKVSNNELLIQKVKDDTVQPTKLQRVVIDVRKEYSLRYGVIRAKPTKSSLVECKACQRSFVRRQLGKHFEVQHAHEVKNCCNACDTVFKSVFSCASHSCPVNTIK